jgi:hypothetical protein
MMAKEKLEKEEEKKIPHFSNLNEDPALSGKLVYLVKEGCRREVIYLFTISCRGNSKDRKNISLTLFVLEN